MTRFTNHLVLAGPLLGVLVFAACSDEKGIVDPLDVSPSLDHVLTVTDGGAAGTFVDYNATCTDLGYDFGFKVDAGGGINVNGEWTVDGFGSITVEGDGTGWNFTSSFPIHGAFSKGGEGGGGQLYDYGDEGTFGDSGLYSGFNASGIAQNISHVDLCFNAGHLTVEKTAVTSFTRDHDWSIEKTAAPVVQWADRDGDGISDANYLKVNSGNSAGVSYTVAVSSTGFVDSDWAVSGTITVTNNTGIDARVVSVSDLLDNGLAPAVDCPALPATLAPGGSLECSYATPLGSGANLMNTATAEADPTLLVEVSAAEGDTWKLYGSGHVESGSGSAAVVFGEPTLTIDGTVTVTDSYAEFGLPAEVGLDGFSRTYAKFFGGVVCETTDHTNVAEFSGASGETGSASVTVTVDVVGCGEPPQGVCSLTQGYWKTHSMYGPASKPDATWDLVGGPDAPLFDSGLTWHEAFWTAPRGDAFFILAHQYMAAKLNQLNGADVSEIANELQLAEEILAANGPGDLRGRDGAAAKELAQILDDYNNGLIGPGHCSDAPRD